MLYSYLSGFRLRSTEYAPATLPPPRYDRVHCAAMRDYRTQRFEAQELTVAYRTWMPKCYRRLSAQYSSQTRVNCTPCGRHHVVPDTYVQMNVTCNPTFCKTFPQHLQKWLLGWNSAAASRLFFPWHYILSRCKANGGSDVDLLLDRLRRCRLW